MTPPEGTLTFLFTDIEGSTKLWEEHPEPMRHALTCHDALMRSAIEQNNGYVFKTVGDAFCAAFNTANDALTAALAAQQELQAQVWPEPIAIRVRMGLHTGVAELRDEDYFGPTVNRASRVMSVGHGGQVLLSDVARDLCCDNLPPRTSLLPLGEHRLKDLFRPESLFQLVHPDLPFTFLPLKSLDNPDSPNNLPGQVTSFIGREKEIDAAKALLTKTRLLTLTGSGGCGKTRLSLQVAADLLEESSDGVWFVELAPLSDPDLVAQSVAKVFGIMETGGQSPLHTLLDALKSREILLVLDNCEHLISACAQLTDTLIKQCPHLKVLVSSREPLGISGELIYRIPPLSLPNKNQSYTAETLSTFESVHLFIERAQFHQPAFQVTNHNAPALASICHHLGGIPLAIELAAARIRSLSVEEISNKLDQCFRLLTGGSRTALPRQRTLSAAIDWSYDLLNDAEKALLRRLSVFAGGWTLNAAEQICSLEGIEDWEVMDLLTSLVDKSLVQYEDLNGQDRYHYLETIRQYAQSKLSKHQETQRIQERHLTYFLSLAIEAEAQLKGPNQQEWSIKLVIELDNVRTAMAWCRETDKHAEENLQLAGYLWRFWYTRGYLTEGLTHLRHALSREGAEKRTPTRAMALNGAGILLTLQGNYDATRPYYEESLAIYSECGDKRAAAFVLDNLGHAALEQGDYEATRTFQEQALHYAREVEDKSCLAVCLGNAALIPFFQGDYEAARVFLEEALVLHRQLQDTHSLATILRQLAEVAYRQGNLGEARSLLLECLPLLQALEFKTIFPYFLDTFASIHSAEGQKQLAVQLWGMAAALREEIGSPLAPNEQPLYTRLIADARTAMGDDAAFDAAWSQGRALTLEQAIERALEKPRKP